MSRVDVINVMGEDGGATVVRLEIIQKLSVDLGHHGSHRGVEPRKGGGVVVDQLVVVLLGFFQRLEMLGIQLDVGLAVAAFNDVDHQIVDDLGIDGADILVDEFSVMAN